MEPKHETPSEAAPSPLPEAGELIVQNGRLSGTRRPLATPATLIGRADGCDIRLNVEGIEPLHCLVIHSSAGVVLRSLAGDGSTFVNGQPCSTGLLHDGDTLSIGPFRFCMRLPQNAPVGPSGKVLLREMETLEREKEALRIQAAAVVAQQAALSEEEAKLEQRRLALQLQEEQLATHLDERRQRLEDLQNRVREARASLQKGRMEHDRRQQTAQREVEQLRTETLTAQKQALRERERLATLRQRLKKRWHRELANERATLKRREEELSRQQLQATQEAKRLDQERAALKQSRLSWNGEAEVGRRQLQDGWQQFQAQKRHWQSTKAQEQEHLRQRLSEVEQRAANLARLERELAHQQRTWQEQRHDLSWEAEGLDNRVCNLRRKALEQEQELSRLENLLRERTSALQSAAPTTEVPSENVPVTAAFPMAPVPQPVVPVALPVVPTIVLPDARLGDLEKLAEELTDQRRYLAELYERLILLQQHWQQEHESAAAELEEAGARLLQREQGLLQREQALSAREQSLSQRHREVSEVRNHLEGWLARLAEREAACEGERERVLHEAQVREALADRQVQLLSELRRRWVQRRRQEAKQLVVDHQRWLSFRQQYAILWEECFRRRTELEQEQRVVAERSLALEQYRLEFLGQSPNSAATEKALERLRRRWLALTTDADKHLTQQRQALHAEAERLQEQARFLQQHADRLTQGKESLGERLATWEQEQALAEINQARLRQELQSTQVQRDLYERQLNQVRDELERVARLLIENGEPTPLVQAA